MRRAKTKNEWSGEILSRGKWFRDDDKYTEIQTSSNK